MTIADVMDAAGAAPESADTRALAEQMERIEAKLDRVLDFVDQLDRRVEGLAELREDFVPILNDAAKLASHKLQQWERTGALDFIREGAGVVETVATSFTPDDVRLLAENVVTILQTVRELTQPEVLAVADRAAHALREAGSQPPGRLRLVKELRDPEVRRGMGVLFSVLKELGSDNGHAPSPTPSALELTGAGAD